jgi:hypothetical protein
MHPLATWYSTAGDVLFQDEDVCILKPDSLRGVECYHRSKRGGVCEGLMSGAEVIRQSPGSLDRSIQHEKIFFRAPFVADETRPYGDLTYLTSDDYLAFIRVDPEKTFVYSSEIRVSYGHLEPSDLAIKLRQSRKSLKKYMEIIKRNEERVRSAPAVDKYGSRVIPVYNLFSSEFMYSIVYSTDGMSVKAPSTTYPIQRNSEILVHLPIIPKEWFTRCGVPSGVLQYTK